MLERLLRAGAAVVAGLGIAWEHLHGSADQEDAGPTAHACPICGSSLTAGPHTHDDVVIWMTDHDGAVLVTRHDGSDAVVITGCHS